MNPISRMWFVKGDVKEVWEEEDEREGEENGDGKKWAQPHQTMGPLVTNGDMTLAFHALT